MREAVREAGWVALREALRGYLTTKTGVTTGHGVWKMMRPDTPRLRSPRMYLDRRRPLLCSRQCSPGANHRQN